jgi:hypothetical protein
VSRAGLLAFAEMGLNERHRCAASPIPHFRGHVGAAFVRRRVRTGPGVPLVGRWATLTIAAAAGPPARIPVSIGSLLMGAAWLGFGRACWVLGSVAGPDR